MLALVVIMVDDRHVNIGRNRFIEELKARRIGSSVHFIPLHLHPYYVQKYGYQRGDFPVAEAVYDKIISIPLYPKLQESQIEYIIDMIREIAHTYRK